MPNKTRALFNHLISPQQQRRRDRETERLGRLEVDDQLELCGPLHWQIGGRRSSENFVNVDGRTLPSVIGIRRVTYEPALLDKGSPRIYPGQPVLHRELDDPRRLRICQRIAVAGEGLDLGVGQCVESAV